LLAGAIGHSGGALAHRGQVPDVIVGEPEVRGPIDKKIVRRTARRHVGEARYCYEQGLARQRDLEGRVVVVRFTIARSGRVIAPGIQRSTIANAWIEDCFVAAVRRWHFSPPRSEARGYALHEVTRPAYEIGY